jgi:hypothetical protein
MRRKTLIFGLCLTLASPGYADVSYPEGGSPGDFVVGDWQGGCRRDGNLRGSNSESCGVSMESGAPISITMVRTFRDLNVSVNFTDCARGVYKGEMTAKQLAYKDRVPKLEKLINDLLKREKRKCALEADLPGPVTLEDLADILKETDGLEF